MKLIFNIGWAYSDHLYEIALKIINDRLQIPKELEIQHKVWAEICKGYWKDPNYVYFINVRDERKYKSSKKL